MYAKNMIVILIVINSIYGTNDTILNSNKNEDREIEQKYVRSNNECVFRDEIIKINTCNCFIEFSEVINQSTSQTWGFKIQEVEKTLNDFVKYEICREIIITNLKNFFLNKIKSLSDKLIDEKIEILYLINENNEYVTRLTNLLTFLKNFNYIVSCLNSLNETNKDNKLTITASEYFKTYIDNIIAIQNHIKTLQKLDILNLNMFIYELKKIINDVILYFYSLNKKYKYFDINVSPLKRLSNLIEFDFYALLKLQTEIDYFHTIFTKVSQNIKFPITTKLEAYCETVKFDMKKLTLNEYHILLVNIDNFDELFKMMDKIIFNYCSSLKTIKIKIESLHSVFDEIIRNIFKDTPSIMIYYFLLAKLKENLNIYEV